MHVTALFASRQDLLCRRYTDFWVNEITADGSLVCLKPETAVPAKPPPKPAAAAAAEESSQPAAENTSAPEVPAWVDNIAVQREAFEALAGPANAAKFQDLLERIAKSYEVRLTAL